jgi:hypothetical protein
MHYRAAAFLAAILVGNVVTILKFLHVGQRINSFVATALIVTGIFLSYSYFVDPKRHRRIFKQFRNENATLKIAGSIAVFLYVVLSFILFVHAMAM